jgi:hypothetical protein
MTTDDNDYRLPVVPWQDKYIVLFPTPDHPGYKVMTYKAFENRYSAFALFTMSSAKYSKLGRMRHLCSMNLFTKLARTAFEDWCTRYGY